MGLEQYGRKRRFAQTPEPAPALVPAGGNRFVVQKHRASRLHYDFRLEMGGVLKSWAVPKGPSLNPADKRLAMMVEDHPVAYFDFEGNIPPGNYGAGSVMLWDTGTWEPAVPAGARPPQTAQQRDELAEAMLAKGDLKFKLHGQRLQGSFVLAHMRARGSRKEREWLLIKHRDADAVAAFDVEQADRSVVSGRTLDEIAHDRNSASWESDRAAGAKNEPTKPTKQGTRSPRAAKTGAAEKIKGARRAQMPAQVAPMLATLVAEPFSDPAWSYEIKWDGYRALAFVDDGQARLVSRNQNSLTAQFPELRDLAASLAAHRAIVDGEICALDGEGRPSFSLMQQRAGGLGPRRIRGGKAASADDIPLVYYAFDLLYLDGYDLRQVEWEQRSRLLQSVLRTGERVRYSEHFDDGPGLYEAARQRGLEGIVAKRRGSCYAERRSRDWLKMKFAQRQECVIGGYTDPCGSREHFGSLVLGLYDARGRLVHVGQAGSGFTVATQHDLWQKMQAIRSVRSPFYGAVEATRRTHWVKPVLVAEIKFTEWTHEGPGGGVKMRAPVFLGLRFDKEPRQCVIERPVRAEPADAA